MQTRHFTASIWLKLFAVLISGIVALLLASIEYQGWLRVGFADLRGFGWIGVVAYFGVSLVAVLFRADAKWVVAASGLQIASLAVDELALLSIGKAQLILALVVLSQWFAVQVRMDSMQKRLLVLFFFLTGCFIQTVFFLSMLRHQNYVGVFQ